MRVEVLYIAGCQHHRPAVQRTREVLRDLNLPDAVNETEVRTPSEAEGLRFPGSPTVRVNGVDVEPGARGMLHFGVGCRSYLEDGRRSGLPSKDLIRRALQEGAGALQTAAPGLRKGSHAGGTALAAGALAAVMASTCCLGPLLLVALGFSGAWIGSLARFEPYRPFFLGAAVIALLFAARILFRPAAGCGAGDLCASRGARRTYKVLFGIVTALVVFAFAYPYFARFFY